jgi:hypothetical protein
MTNRSDRRPLELRRPGKLFRNPVATQVIDAAVIQGSKVVAITALAPCLATGKMGALYPALCTGPPRER